MRANTRMLAIAAVTLLTGLPAKSQSVIINGGFESPAGSSPSTTTALPNGSTIVPGWVSVDTVSSSTADNFLYHAPYYGNAASQGQNFIYIDNNNYASPTLNGIYQDFSAVTGQTYRVTFDATTELGGSAGKLGVSVGAETFHFTLANAGLPPVSSPPYTPFTPWASYSLTFTAVAANTRLLFFDEGFQIGGDPLLGNASPLLDNVSVTAIPEPSAFAALLGILAFGLVFYRKRPCSMPES